MIHYLHLQHIHRGCCDCHSLHCWWRLENFIKKFLANILLIMRLSCSPVIMINGRWLSVYLARTRDAALPSPFPSLPLSGHSPTLATLNGFAMEFLRDSRCRIDSPWPFNYRTCNPRVNKWITPSFSFSATHSPALARTVCIPNCNPLVYNIPLVRPWQATCSCI